MVQRPIPMVFLVRKTIDIPWRSTFPGGRCPCLQVVQILHCCLFKTVEIHSAARRHPCRGSDADSLGLPQRFSSCCTLTRWSSWVVQVLQFSSADVEETADLPQLRRFAWTLALHMPVDVQRQVPYGR